MDDRKERMRILEMIENGQVDVNEGLDLLHDLISGEPQQDERGSPKEAASHTLPPEVKRFHRWWMIPLWVGVGITTLGGLLMLWAQQVSGFGFWFLCAAIPFTLGVLVVLLAWESRKSPWIHLRFEQEPDQWPQRFALNFPAPVRPTAWFLRKFGHRVPHLKETSIDEVLQAIEETTSPDNPVFIQVDEGKGGERVEIYIG